MKKGISIDIAVCLLAVLLLTNVVYTVEYETIDIEFTGWVWDINNNTQSAGYVHAGETHTAYHENGERELWQKISA